MLDKYDVVIIGGGPAGLYTAYGLVSKNHDQKITEKSNLKIAVIEKGKSLKKRKCPAIEKSTNCVGCKNCSIMTGIGGCGSFSDGKVPITNDFGGNLWEKIGKSKSLELQREVDRLNRKFYLRTRGLSDSQINWSEVSCNRDAFKGGADDFPELFSSRRSNYKKICTQHNLHLLDADIRHLGTDKGQIVYNQLYDELVIAGVDFYTETEATSVMTNPDIDTRDEYAYYVGTKSSGFYAKNVVVAAGRSGSKWVSKICEDLNIETRANKVDIGIRFECPDEIWNHVTRDLYEAKIVYKTETYEDEVRTFCMNPSGEVVNENTNGIVTVNGHAFEDETKKTKNTNFALLVSQTFTEPFNDSNEYGTAIVRLSNMLGGGVIVQRYGDLIRGRRSTKNHILHNTVTPTLNAEPGDLSLVLPKRILDDIMEMIEKLDHLVPGMTNDDNLLYGVELKQYNMTVDVNEDLEAKNYKNLYFIGDGAGWTHSLSQSSASGLYVAEKILNKE